MTVKQTRTRNVSIRMTTANRDAAERVAEITGRTVSSLTEFALVKYMQENHPGAFMQPTYYTAHPDGVFRVAVPQPIFVDSQK